jgi:hypothetical protein
MLVSWIAHYQAPPSTLLAAPPATTGTAALVQLFEGSRPPEQPRQTPPVLKLQPPPLVKPQPQLRPKTPMPNRPTPSLDTNKVLPPPPLPAAVVARSAVPHPPVNPPPLSLLGPHPPVNPPPLSLLAPPQPAGPPPPTPKARPLPGISVAVAETGATVTAHKSKPTPKATATPEAWAPPGPGSPPPHAMSPAEEAAAKKARRAALQTINTTKFGTVIYEGVLDLRCTMKATYATGHCQWAAKPSRGCNTGGHSNSIMCGCTKHIFALEPMSSILAGGVQPELYTTPRLIPHSRYGVSTPTNRTENRSTFQELFPWAGSHSNLKEDPHNHGRTFIGCGHTVCRAA